MLITKTFISLMMLFPLCVLAQNNAANTEFRVLDTSMRSAALPNNTVLMKVAPPSVAVASWFNNQRKAESKSITVKNTQAATAIEEDGTPTGPDKEVGSVYLADSFQLHGSYSIREDFQTKIPFSDEIIRDHTSLNTYYFYPAGYLLNYDSLDGFEINFLHRTRAQESDEDLIVMTFTLMPRQLNGGIALLQEFAQYAIKPANNKPVDILRLPISSLTVNMSGLSSLIHADNIVIDNSPRKVGDPIKVRATMTQSQKEDVVASIRDGGLSGDIIFKTYSNTLELTVPYLVSLTDFTGDWLTDVTELSITESFMNLSPHPLALESVVVYAKAKSGDTLHRYDIPLSKPVLMDVGAVASTDKNFSQLVASYGEVVAAWPNYERITCEECLNTIENEILVSPAQASRTDLPIEVIPNIFDQFSLFKVLVEVRSELFSSNNNFTETRTITLRKDSTQQTEVLYVNRDSVDGASKFEYRVKPYHMDGLGLGVSEWKPDNGVMDITITAGDIRPLIPEAQ